VSGYHQFFEEPHGSETRPTFYLLWKESRPYHLDYCFIPRSWASRVVRVDVGSFEEWRKHSDHRPLLVEIGRTRRRSAIARPAQP
jgi:endonuclease/exonuclease/phosphatase family metal-dependent hydrolase